MADRNKKKSLQVARACARFLREHTVQRMVINWRAQERSGVAPAVVRLFEQHVSGMMGAIKPTPPLSDLYTKIEDDKGATKSLYWVDLVLEGE